MSRHRRLLRPLALGLALLAAPPPASSEEPPSPHFWDRYVAAKALLKGDARAARARAESLLDRDPDDFLGSWLRGAVAERPEAGAASTALLAEAENPATTPGTLVAAGSFLSLRGTTERGGGLLRKASVEYAARGRDLDACRALTWRVLLGAEARDPAGAERDVAAAESLARRVGDPETLADLLLLKGRLAYRKDFQAALAIRREALALLEPLGPSYQLVECLRGIGNALNKREEYGEAASHFLRARDLAGALGYRDEEGECLNGLGNTRKGEGRFREALDLFARAAAIGEETGDSPLAAAAYGNMGDLEKRLAHYRAARENIEKAISHIGRAGGDDEKLVMSLDALASLDAITGNLERARERLEEALALCERSALDARTPFLILHLAQVHHDLRNPAQALVLAERGIEAARRAGHRKAELPLLTLTSQILCELGRAEEAVEVARESIRLTMESRSAWWYWEAHGGFAQALDAAGRVREAIAVLDSVIDGFSRLPDSLELGALLTGQANFYLGAGEPERAASAAARALAVARSLDNRLLERRALLAHGEALVAVGRPSEAIPPLEECLAAVERSRSFLTVSEERSGLVSRWYGGYASLATAHARMGRGKDAFAVLERSRAREMRELFGVGAPGLSQRVPANLAAALAGVEAELAEIQAEILQQYARPVAERTEDLADRERRADSLKTVWSDLSQRVAREAPALAREAGLSKPMAADEVLRSLAPDERLLAYMTGRDAMLLFDFWRGRISVHEIPWGEKKVAEMVSRFTEALHATDTEAWREEARSLGEMLLGPCGLAPQEEPDVLYVLPDGALNYLPFEALIVPGSRPETARHVVDMSDVVYANSATLLLNPPGSGSRGARRAHDYALVAFGDPGVGNASDLAPAASTARGSLPALVPLPHARREVLSLPPLFEKAAVYVGDEATEGRFYEEAARAPILHVAAHAFVDDRHPEFSGIVLCPGSARAMGAAGEDGIVQAFEIVKREFDLDLATLSACETGRGSLLRGEGLIGLSRAFRLAGARNLVVSLWKVDDAATAAFMQQFYRRLSGGAAPATALRGAKLALFRGGAEGGSAREEADGPGRGEDSSAATRGVGRRERPDTLSGPSAWAGFVLVGSRARSAAR